MPATEKVLADYINEKMAEGDEWRGWDPYSLADGDVERIDRLMAIMEAVVAIVNEGNGRATDKRMANKLRNLYDTMRGSYNRFTERPADPPEPGELEVRQVATDIMNDWEAFREDSLAYLNRRREQVATWRVKTMDMYGKWGKKFTRRAWLAYGKEEERLGVIFGWYAEMEASLANERAARPA